MQKVRITFLIENAQVGDFIHAWADKIQLQEIVAVHGVAFNKNTSVGANRTEARAIGNQARIEVVELLRAGPLLSGQILDNFPKYPKPWLRQIIYRLHAEGTLVKTKKDEYLLRGQPESTEGGQPKRSHKKAGSLPMPSKLNSIGAKATGAKAVKNPRPPGGYNFEKPEIRAKATARALATQAAQKKKTGSRHPGGSSTPKRPTASSQAKVNPLSRLQLPPTAVKPAVPAKKREAGRKAVETAQKRGIDFAALGRKGNEAKLRKRQEAALQGTANGHANSAPTPPVAPASGE